MHKSLRISDRNKELYNRYIIRKKMQNVNCTKGYVLGLLLEEPSIKNASNTDIMNAYNELNKIISYSNISNPTSFNLKTSTIADLDAWYSRCRLTIPSADLSLCIDIAFTIANSHKDIKTWNSQVSEKEKAAIPEFNLWVLIEDVTKLCKKAAMGDEESNKVLRDIQSLIEKK